MGRILDGVEVFSTTRKIDSNEIGQRITDWRRRSRYRVQVVEVNVRQSSDDERHCLTIVVWWRWK